jgi:predicted RNase H-like nuclease (RuvC/YqgF family)
LQQKNIKEQKTELKKQKKEILNLENEITILNTKLKSSEDKSDQDQLKIELLQKTISNLKSELQKQATQILELKKTICPHNHKLDNIQSDQIVGHYFQQDLIQTEKTKITKKLKVQLRDLMTVYPLRATQSLFKATSNTNLRSKQKENSR